MVQCGVQCGTMWSQCGYNEEKIIKKWRLEPGKMLLIDLQAGRIIDDGEVKKLLASAKPYEKWIKQSRFLLSDIKNSKSNKFSLQESLLDTQQAFGFTQEDINFIIKDILKRPFITFGFISFVLLIPLVVTSPKKMLKKLLRVYIGYSKMMVNFMYLYLTWICYVRFF